MLLEHEETSPAGSIGLVLNKASSLPLEQAARVLSLADDACCVPAESLGALAGTNLHVGGPVASPLLVLHRKRGSSSLELCAAAESDQAGSPMAAAHAARVDAALRATHLPLHASPLTPAFAAAATRQINAKVATAGDFKPLIGSTVWGAGQLRGEWDDAGWYAADLASAAEARAAADLIGGWALETESAEVRYAIDARVLEVHQLADHVEEMHAQLKLRRQDPSAAADDDAPGELYMQQMLDEHMLSAPLLTEQVHELIDGEMVGASGQRAWAAVLGELGGEYAAIAGLAHTLEDQVMHAISGDLPDDHEAEWEEEEEDL